MTFSATEERLAYLKSL